MQIVCFTGTDCNEKDTLNLFPVSRNFNAVDDQLATLKQNDSTNLHLPLKRSFSSTSTGREDILTPYTDDIRKRLQVVSSASPVPSSPVNQVPSFPVQEKNDNNGKNLVLSSGFPIQNKNEKNFLLGLQKTSISNQAAKRLGLINKNEKKPNSKNNIFINNNDKLTASLGSKSKNYFENFVPKQSFVNAPTSETSGMRRNNSGFWKTLKTWNTKRKETKQKEKLESDQNNKMMLNHDLNVAALKELNELALKLEQNQEAEHDDGVWFLPIRDSDDKNINLEDALKQPDFQPSSSKSEIENLSRASSDKENKKKFSSATDFVKWENECCGLSRSTKNPSFPRSYSLTALDEKFFKQNREKLPKKQENSTKIQIFGSELPTQKLLSTNDTRPISRKTFLNNETQTSSPSFASVKPVSPSFENTQDSMASGFDNTDSKIVSFSENLESAESGSDQTHPLGLNDNGNRTIVQFSDSPSDQTTMLFQNSADSNHVSDNVSLPLVRDVSMQKLSSGNKPYFCELDAVQELLRDEEKSLAGSSLQKNNQTKI